MGEKTFSFDDILKMERSEVGIQTFEVIGRKTEIYV